MANYRQMLIDEEAHTYISEAKELLGASSGKRVSSKEVINELVGRRVRYLRLRREVRDYINEFVSNAARDPHICGLLLFGSVAKGNFGRYSDIDIMVLVDVKDTISYTDTVREEIKRAEPERKALVEHELYLNINPLVLSLSETGKFRPIYVNFLEEGIVLFERKELLTNFLNSVRKNVIYDYSRVNDTMVMRWRIKG